jgi:nicotinate-nucleotide adenylyltransferase
MPLTRVVKSVAGRDNIRLTNKRRNLFMRMGLFGGSFDPVHLGHLWIGEAATEMLSLDRLLWIPSATQPLKPGGPVAADEQRLDMLRLAIAGRRGHQLDAREIRREGVSYTVDTVAEVREEFPDASLFLLIGSDSLRSMRQWHQPQRLLAQVTLAVVQRGGEDEIDFSILRGLVDPDRMDSFRESVIKMPVIEISSSDIRHRVGRGDSIRHRVPRSVEAYIRSNGVYQACQPEST